MNTTTCPLCQVTYGIGSSPWCRDGHTRGSSSIEDVTWPGGIVFENLGHEPVRCDSPADLKREMDARGLQPFVRHLPGDRHTTSWATMDPYTLAAAKALADRQGSTRASSDDGPSPATVAIVREVLGV